MKKTVQWDRFWIVSNWKCKLLDLCWPPISNWWLLILETVAFIVLWTMESGKAFRKVFQTKSQPFLGWVSIRNPSSGRHFQLNFDLSLRRTRWSWGTTSSTTLWDRIRSTPDLKLERSNLKNSQSKYRRLLVFCIQFSKVSQSNSTVWRSTPTNRRPFWESSLNYSQRRNRKVLSGQKRSASFTSRVTESFKPGKLWKDKTTIFEASEQNQN